MKKAYSHALSALLLLLSSLGALAQNRPAAGDDALREVAGAV
jgi:hypothetical protein